MALLKEMVPQAKTIGILWDAHAWGERVGGEMARRTEKAVLAAGARAEIVAVRGPDDLERAFSLLKQAQVDGLLVEQSPVYFSSQEVGRTGSGSEASRDLSIRYLITLKPAA
jgi:DNA-binding LacI/PurR family transcriptional regulator